MSSFRGKVVLITGASSGIGEGAAVHFAQLSCKLSLTGRNKENLEKVANDCKEAGARPDEILVVTGDLSNDDDIVRIMEATITHFQKLDILVNNAGFSKQVSIENLSMELHNSIMKVNVGAPLMLTQLAIPHLKKTKGNIVNISSIAGYHPYKEYSSYAMSKGALDQLTRCAALELSEYKIRVNSVNPGPISTPIWLSDVKTEEERNERIEFISQITALGRCGTVEEVAAAVEFLADDSKASFITGVTLTLDGGLNLKTLRGAEV